MVRWSCESLGVLGRGKKRLVIFARSVEFFLCHWNLWTAKSVTFQSPAKGASLEGL